MREMRHSFAGITSIIVRDSGGYSRNVIEGSWCRGITIDARTLVGSLAHSTIECAWAGVASVNIAIAEKIIVFMATKLRLPLQ